MRTLTVLCRECAASSYLSSEQSGVRTVATGAVPCAEFARNSENAETLYRLRCVTIAACKHMGVVETIDP
jgi:hypothetical protein